MERRKMGNRPRGSGYVWRPPKSQVYWCQYFVQGQRFRESTHETSERRARRYLDDQVAEGRVNGRPVSATLTVGDLVEAKLVSDRNDGLKDIRSSEGRWNKNLQPFFGHIKARDLTTPIINRYAAKRRGELLAKYQRQADSAKAQAAKAQKNGDAEKAKELIERAERAAKKSPTATVNRELAIVRAAFHLGRKSGLVRDVPYFAMPTEHNTRTGFLEPGEYDKLVAATMAEGHWLRTLFELGYAYGWRRSEMLGLTVGDLHFLDGPNGEGTVSLPDSKNGDPRIVTMTRKVRELLLACIQGKAASDRVLTRGRKPIVDYREAWARVLKEAGIKRHLLVHDLRRTAVRGMRDRGIDRKVAMNITGHRTESVYNRYNIADLADISKATAKLDAEQAKFENSQRTAKAAENPFADNAPPQAEVKSVQPDAKWAHQDSNLGPTDYESAALTN